MSIQWTVSEQKTDKPKVLEDDDVFMEPVEAIPVRNPSGIKKCDKTDYEPMQCMACETNKKNVASYDCHPKMRYKVQTRPAGSEKWPSL